MRYRQTTTMPGGYVITVHGTPTPDGHLVPPHDLDRAVTRVHTNTQHVLAARTWTGYQALTLVMDHLSLALLEWPNLHAVELATATHAVSVDLHEV